MKPFTLLVCILSMLALTSTAKTKEDKVHVNRPQG